jgi:hypothetical protein
MGKAARSELSVDQRRLIGYAMCALVDACPEEHKQQLQFECSVLAAKLGIVAELSEALQKYERPPDTA